MSDSNPYGDRELREASTEALIQALIILTHQIHTLRDARKQTVSFETLSDYRFQRDLVKAEIVRRADGE